MLYCRKLFVKWRNFANWETHSSCCGLGCGEVKCPLCIDRCDFDSYVLKKNSCLEKVAGKFQLKRSHNYFFQVQQQLFTLPERKYNDFVVCAFDSFHRATIVKERIYPDHGHMNAVLPKLTIFWRTCILPEIFRQMVLKKVWYVWWDATSRCWNMLLQNAIRWKHCEMWEPSMPICWISSILFGNFNPTSQGVVLPTLLQAPTV